MSKECKVAVISGASQGIGAVVVATSRSIKPSSDTDVLTVAGDIGDPVGRIGEIADVNGVLHLESAPFATGEILNVDGGHNSGH
jgi:NAD(P)-dependent dehydrogenase (short-subunit alcohol dehydrogenase family)